MRRCFRHHYGRSSINFSTVRSRHPNNTAPITRIFAERGVRGTTMLRRRWAHLKRFTWTGNSSGMEVSGNMAALSISMSSSSSSGAKGRVGEIQVDWFGGRRRKSRLKHLRVPFYAPIDIRIGHGLTWTSLVSCIWP